MLDFLLLMRSVENLADVTIAVCLKGRCLRKRNSKTSCLQEPPKENLVVKPKKTTPRVAVVTQQQYQMFSMFRGDCYCCSAAHRCLRTKLPVNDGHILPFVLLRISSQPRKEGKEEACSSKHQSDAGLQRRLPPVRWAGWKHRAGPGRHRHAVRQQQRVWVGRWEVSIITV